MCRLLVFILSVCVLRTVSGITPAFDKDLYKRVLDPELCESQLRFLRNDSLLLSFLDASAKLPTGVLNGNLRDLGNYYQCLAIDTDRGGLHFEGKYCAVSLPLDHLQSGGGRSLADVENDEGVNLRRAADAIVGRPRAAGSGSRQSGFTLAYCIPKVCTINDTLDFYLGQLQQVLNISYTEMFCRLPNDKPYAPADYLALIVLSVIMLLTVASTIYDLYYTFICQQESHQLLSSFSVYTNTRRFLTFPTGSTNLSCIDGIRAASMMWVVVGHTYINTVFMTSNIVDAFEWIQSFRNVWVTSAPISVDTFFMLSGVLCAYTTVSKVTRSYFIRNLHLFYLNRLLRMFPLLALVVLLQASLLNHVSDGPLWTFVAGSVESCRRHWWSALLHVQNYVNPTDICLGQTWYLSVDIQLYIVCPIVLIFLFGRRWMSWGAITLGVLLSLMSASIISFQNNFQGTITSMNGQTDMLTYMKLYYFNPFTRAPPFFVGLAVGYYLHIIKNKQIRLNKYQVILLWLLSLAMMGLAIIPVYYMSQSTFSNQTFANFFNSYVRAVWAAGLGWLVIACQHGYGGPINWFLSLPMWRLPARLSYAVYLVHYPLMAVANASWVHTHYFTNGDTLYRFLADLTLSTLVSFVICIIVDAPFSTIQKRIFEGRRNVNKSKPQSNGVAPEREEISAKNGPEETRTVL